MGQLNHVTQTKPFFFQSSDFLVLKSMLLNFITDLYNCDHHAVIFFGKYKQHFEALMVFIILIHLILAHT